MLWLTKQEAHLASDHKSLATASLFQSLQSPTALSSRTAKEKNGRKRELISLISSSNLNAGAEATGRLSLCFLQPDLHFHKNASQATFGGFS